MRDRATQALAKAALEPEWEAKFEPNSYGFRPGRGAHDAIEAIFNQIKFKPKFVLDADISKCFDKINHQKLLDKLNTFPILRRQVKAWLKADIVDFKKHEKTPNHQGTPQGGVLSPLLSNIALHGMEKRIKQYAATWKGYKRDNISSIALIRYADDFVILHNNLEVIKRRHPNKNKTWIVNKYWKTIGGDNWVFGEKEGATLIKHPSTAISRHTKVKGEVSPYDGNTLYWGKRKGSHPELKDSVARLLKKQKGKCMECNLTFQDGDLIETDHIIPRAIGGNIKDNLQLLHKHCHDVKTKNDLKAIKQHKVKKEWQETLRKFNKENWLWADDIPTLVKGTHL